MTLHENRLDQTIMYSTFNFIHIGENSADHHILINSPSNSCNLGEVFGTVMVWADTSAFQWTEYLPLAGILGTALKIP